MSKNYLFTVHMERTHVLNYCVRKPLFKIFYSINLLFMFLLKFILLDSNFLWLYKVKTAFGDLIVQDLLFLLILFNELELNLITFISANLQIFSREVEFIFSTFLDNLVT